MTGHRNPRAWGVAFCAARIASLLEAAEPPPARPAAPEIVCSAAWDSAYVTEGRDNLGAGGLFSTAVDVAWLGFGFSGWLARGDSGDYTEINLGLARRFLLGPVGLTAGYTRLEFGGEADAPGDNEFSLSFAADLPGKIAVEAGGRHSTRAGGTFFEFAARRRWETGVAGVVLTPYVMQGYDCGYASEAHDGSNHFEAGLVADLRIARSAALAVYLAHCWAQADVRRDGLGDVTWGGVSVAVGF